LPEKSNKSNQLPVVNVGMAAPPVIESFGALLELPPVVPKVNVAVTPMELVKPPGPDSVNPVAMAMLSTVVAAVVCVRLIFPAVVLPNAMDRELALVELKMPVASVAPSANVNVPAVNVYVPVAANEKLVLNVTVPAVCVNAGTALNVPPLSVNDPDVNTKLVLGVIVPVVKLNEAPLIVNVVQLRILLAVSRLPPL